MIVKLLTEHHFEFLSLKEPAEARPSLLLSKCQIVGNLMHWLKFLHYLHILSKNMGQLGVFHENTRTSQIFWWKLISLRSMLSDKTCDPSNMGLVTRERVFVVSVIVSFKPVSSATETS